MFFLPFSYQSLLLIQGFRLRCCGFYTFIYSYNCRPNVKNERYRQKIHVNLVRFEEILLFLQWLSSLYVKLSSLNVDKQTANAELKAGKSKQLSR